MKDEGLLLRIYDLEMYSLDCEFQDSARGNAEVLVGSKHQPLFLTLMSL